MNYSRRDFLKAAGSGIVLTAVGGDTVGASTVFRSGPRAGFRAPMTKESAQRGLSTTRDSLSRSDVMTALFHELDTVVLLRDLPEAGLRSGDLGAIVQVYGGEALEVEFVTASGRTQALLTLLQAPPWRARRAGLPAPSCRC